jgi:hypothetical protein
METQCTALLTAKSTALLFPRKRADYSAMLKRDNHAARKIEWALQQPGITPNGLRRLAKLKSKSAVSEWKRTGRIAKHHIPLLAARTNTIERWWLTKDAPIPPTVQWTTAREPNATIEPVSVGHRTLAELSTAQAKLLEVWARLTKTQQASQMDQLQATAASNIEIAEHLVGLGITRVISDSEVKEKLRPEAALREGITPGSVLQQSRKEVRKKP